MTFIFLDSSKSNGTRVTPIQMYSIRDFIGPIKRKMMSRQYFGCGSPQIVCIKLDRGQLGTGNVEKGKF